MYVIRSAQPRDLNDLLGLSELVQFINLPNDPTIIEKKLKKSIKSFEKPSKIKEDNLYIFVLENLLKKQVVGVSMIHGQHGTEDEPHYFLKVGQEQKFSETLNTGFIHGTLTLDYEPNGYSEIGGLVLHPELRNNGLKLGKQLSFTRFLFIGLHKNNFTPVIHTELMPPLDASGNSPLWEAIGRRFMNMNYNEADILSRKNKEFIFSLWPSGKIYTTLLPVEAREAIGKVGDDTKPVIKMLEDIGFKYTWEVDPFDGGPHYRCKTDDIQPIKGLKKYNIEVTDSKSSDHELYLGTVDYMDYKFCTTHFKVIDKSKDVLFVQNTDLEHLELAKTFQSYCVQI